MTVKQLIEKLQDYEPETRVVTTYPAHDRHRSTLADDIETIDFYDIVWSEYHRAYKVVESETDGDDDREHEPVLILSGNKLL